MFSRVWVTGNPTSTVLCQCGDPGQAVWFMAWVPYAITHGHNPLFTTRMLSGQGGANLLESTSYLLPSFLLAPVTWLFGATVSFNAAETIAPVLSGWAMYLAAGRVEFPLAAESRCRGAVGFRAADRGGRDLRAPQLRLGVLPTTGVLGASRAGGRQTVEARDDRRVARATRRSAVLKRDRTPLDHVPRRSCRTRMRAGDRTEGRLRPAEADPHRLRRGPRSGGRGAGLPTVVPHPWPPSRRRAAVAGDQRARQPALRASC